MTPDKALDGAHQLRWYQFTRAGASIPYNPDSGICEFWKQNPWLGPPLAPEIYADDGSVYQSFFGGIVMWSPATGAQNVR